MFRTSFKRPIVLITKVGRHSNLASDEDDHMDRVSVGSAGTFLLVPGGVSQAATCDLILVYVPLCRLGQLVRLNINQSERSITFICCCTELFNQRTRRPYAACQKSASPLVSIGH